MPSSPSARPFAATQQFEPGKLYFTPKNTGWGLHERPDMTSDCSVTVHAGSVFLLLEYTNPTSSSDPYRWLHILVDERTGWIAVHKYHFFPRFTKVEAR